MPQTEQEYEGQACDQRADSLMIPAGARLEQRQRSGPPAAEQTLQPVRQSAGL
jgi:hypothetical protein